MYNPCVGKIRKEMALPFLGMIFVTVIMVSGDSFAPSHSKYLLVHISPEGIEEVTSPSHDADAPVSENAKDVGQDPEEAGMQTKGNFIFSIQLYEGCEFFGKIIKI